MNQLTAIDVTKSVNLTFLECSYNQLTSLDVSKNVNLTWLNCTENSISELDISNTKLPSHWNNCDPGVTVIR